MLSDEQARELLRRYREGLCTIEEKETIENWYQQLLDKSSWDFVPGEEELIGARIKARMDERLDLHGQDKIKPIVHKRWYAVAAAAAVIILIAVGTLYLLHKPIRLPATIAISQNNDIPPGGNKAVLTLANGKIIILDSAHKGQVADQGNSKVVKVDSGMLAYNSPLTTQNPQPTTIQYNTLTFKTFTFSNTILLFIQNIPKLFFESIQELR